MIPGGFQELLDEFLLEARERADQVEAILLSLQSAPDAERTEALARVKRELHTLKGNAGMMGFADLQQIAHDMEDQVEVLDLDAPEIDPLLHSLDALRRGLDAVRSAGETGEPPPGSAVGDPDRPSRSDPSRSDAEDDPGDGRARDRRAGDGRARDGRARNSQADEPARGATPAEGLAVETAGGSVRVPFAKIDHLVEMQAETLIFRNRLVDALGQMLARVAAIEGLPAETERELRDAADDVDAARTALEKTLNQVQTLVTELGMVPLQSLFRSLRRIVHDESRREGKNVEMVISGGQTPIDKTLLEAAGDALGHLVRNAVNHGIEAPEVRATRGKPATGRVEVSAEIEAGEVRIEIRDDGGGIDVDGLRAKARRLGGKATDGISDVALLFEEGVSTREATDLGAGRGVGLSAVKKSVERHGGRIRVQSEPARGSVFSLHLPVSAAIQRSLLIAVDDEQYALTLSAIAETLALDSEAIHEVNRAPVVRWRGTLVPLLDLGQLFGTAPARRAQGFVTVIEINGRHRGLILDRLVGIRDIVVKGLDKIVGQPLGISGSTILGDGRVVMILDPASLVTISPSTLDRATPTAS